MIKLIAQKDELGCGVACVAFVLGKSYEEAKEDFLKIGPVEKGYLCKDLVTVLNLGSKNYTYKYLKLSLKRRIYIPGTIVFIERNKKYPFGHYLVRVHGGWMDPWINLLNNADITKAKAGLKRRLPGKSIYGIFLMATA